MMIYRPPAAPALRHTIVAVFGNNVEATGNKVACCFDIVASVDRA